MFIRENYADPNISLHVVASAIGFSPNYFSAIFSQETGETFIEYLTKTRIEAAKKALRETDHELSEIAFDIGYNEPQYFRYIFKKHTGLTPREYRMQESGARKNASCASVQRGCCWSPAVRPKAGKRKWSCSRILRWKSPCSRSPPS